MFGDHVWKCYLNFFEQKYVTLQRAVQTVHSQLRLRLWPSAHQKAAKKINLEKLVFFLCLHDCCCFFFMHYVEDHFILSCLSSLPFCFVCLALLCR